MSRRPQRVPIGPYHYTAAECVDPDPRADEAAGVVAALIREACPQLQVEHIGSTAVPGLPGKGIVDLMVLYPDGMLEVARAALDGLGFQRQTFGDPFPEDRPMRVGTVPCGSTVFRIHAHVLHRDAAEVEALRAFRERLCADPGLAAAYVARKRELIADGIVESPDYAVHKGSFILGALDEWSGRS
jgi:GrpB-like predicted nucleotidyltransferase (UPF0157 family)